MNPILVDWSICLVARLDRLLRDRARSRVRFVQVAAMTATIIQEPAQMRALPKEAPMNSIILCTAATLNIFSAPAGNQVVGTVPVNKEVQLMDGSLLRDWVFIGKPDPVGPSQSPRLGDLRRPRTVSVSEGES